MTFETLIHEIQALPVNERKQLVMVILDSLTEAQPNKPHRILEFERVAAHLRDIDAQEYVTQLRKEWDARP